MTKERDDIITTRKKIFQRKKQIITDLFKSLLIYPNTQEDRETIIRYAIDHNKFPPYKGDLYNLKWDNYFITISISTVCDILKMSRLEFLLEYKRSVNAAEMPNLSQDGSRGQWKAAKEIRLNTINWFLGEENEI